MNCPGIWLEEGVRLVERMKDPSRHFVQEQTGGQPEVAVRGRLADRRNPTRYIVDLPDVLAQ